MSPARGPVRAPRRGCGRAWLCQAQLDRRLAEGANPTTDPLRAQCERPCPRAVALASYLVCDPDSPAYWDTTGATVADLARTALTAIDHQPLR